MYKEIRIALSAALMLGSLTAARADGRWCASVQGPDGGYISCAYASWAQCQAALSGLGGICHRNPAGAERPRHKASRLTTKRLER